MRFLVNSRLCPVEVKFRHLRVEDNAKFDRFFGCPVHFGTDYNSLTFSQSELERPIPTADKRLYRLLTRYCREILASLEEKSREGRSLDLRHRVEKIISKSLCRGNIKIGPVARELGMSVRTLARRLRKGGVSFTKILDELRRKEALRHLRDPDVRLTQIAFYLGYSQPAAFSRAFNRWTGLTPLEWRRRHIP